MGKEKKKSLSKVVSIISIALFSVVISIFLLSLYYDTTGFLIAASIWLGIIPFIASIALAIISIIFYFKDKKNKKVSTILTCVNIIQFIVTFILIFNLGSINKVLSTIKFNPAKKELDKIYADNYEIIDSCHTANSGGTNKITAIIKLKNEDVYSLFTYDISDDKFYDYYNRIKNGEQIQLNQYFDKDIVYIATSNEYIDKYSNPISTLSLTIIVNHNEYGLDELANIIKNIADDHIQKGYKNSVDIKMFFTDKIDFSKLDNYKLLLTSQLADDGFGTNDTFFKKFNKKLVYENYYEKYHIKDNYDLEEISSLLDWALTENGIR